MFDTIGRAPADEEARTRTAIALGIVIVTLTTCWCAVFGPSLLSSAPSVPAVVEVPDEPLIPLEQDAVGLQLEAPMGVRPPPPIKKAAVAAGEAEPDPEPEPPEDEQTPQELPDPPKDTVTSRDAVDGDPDGSHFGADDGEKGGIQGGDPNGTAGGDCIGCTSGPVSVPSSRVRIRRRVDPTYPEEARSLGLTSVVCRLNVQIDATGRPTDVQVSACPLAFHDSARQALFRWRFYPARRGGQKVPARFAIAIRYQLRD